MHFFFSLQIVADKVFSFLSKDEVEKLKQEEERKIATLHRDKKEKKSRLLDDANSKFDNKNDDDDNRHQDDSDEDDDDDEDDYDEDDDDDYENEDAVDMQQQYCRNNANDNIDVLRETLSAADDTAEDIR